MMNEQTIYLMEEFKIPFWEEYCPEDWKDWYHYILFDPVTGIRFLYNICFSGRPGTGYITETVFLTLPRFFLYSNTTNPSEMETFGYARNLTWEKNVLQITPLQFFGDDISFSIENNTLFLKAANRHAGISFRLTGTPAATPVYIPELAPYGNGFIGWGVIPGYHMKGEIKIAGKTIVVDENWHGYHDRNFGRFYWGNIGWVWFILNGIDNNRNKWAYVLHRSNDSEYAKVGSPILFVYCNDVLQKIFLGNMIDIELIWEPADHLPPVLPGAMASIFSDRSLLMPQLIRVRAADEIDTVYLRMTVQTNTEMIVPDSDKKQYTFLKELSGSAEATQIFSNKKSFFKNGFFYAEHVH